MSQSDGRGAIGRFVDELDVTVFGVGFAIAAVAVVGFLLSPDRTAEVMQGTNEYLWSTFGWAYLLVMFTLVAFVFFLIFSPWGNIKLGGPDEEPEFTFLAYFSMIYSAGIAAGIVFWGPAEAIFYFGDVPPLVGAEAETTGAAVGAIRYTFFHWGVSAWCAYTIMALPIAYYAYRHDAPIRISTVIAPFVGLDNLESPWAKAIDVLAVFATIGGVAATLGFVGSQFLVGIEYTTGTGVTDLGTILVITGLTVAFTISVALGVRKGIRRLSYFNMMLFGLLTILTFLLGPTSYIMSVGTEALGGYINQFIEMSFHTGAATGQEEWVGTWTIFYWAWWFSWTPFVGLFIARISRGRTVRQVAATGVLASTAVTLPWFATMGATSIFLQDAGQADVLGTIEAFGGDEAAAGYPMFEALPVGFEAPLLGSLLMLLFIVLITTFFITSADSSTLALGMLTTGGVEQPSTINRVIWGGFIGALASLLLVTGGTDALQQAAIITGGPFALITLLAVGVMILTFGKHHPLFMREENEAPIPSVEPDVGDGAAVETDGAGEAEDGDD
ncbi:BCCT family transporter [Halalkalicoccus tibetensis]|uniref:BCCT family transporter n=1 Tax=Halalkalicoccus tibetensis TaxID=175632 RepID=A0ABD5V6I0_9EURY